MDNPSTIQAAKVLRLLVLPRSFDASSDCTDILQGGTNFQIDIQNPDGLGRQSTDAGTVPNVKWPFSLSKTKIFPGGWTRVQDITDLPSSHDIAAAQQHLRKGALRELHWHKVVCICPSILYSP